MASQIEGNDGQVYAREPAWHGLGVTLPVDAFTAHAAINYANLGWTVEKHPLQTIGGIVVPDKFATVRSDDNSVLGVVGNVYTPLQNIDSFDFFDSIVGEGQAIYNAAGSLFGGRKTWILAKLPNSIEVGDKDHVDQYVLLSNSHDGTSMVTAMFTPIRVVCNNTLQAALTSGAHCVKIRHTGSMAGKLKQAHELLGIVSKTSAETGDLYRAMASRKMSPVEIDNSLLTLVPNGKSDNTTRTENIRAAMMNLIENGEGNRLPTAKDTAWGFYNGVTEYVSHERTVKGLEDDGSDPDGRKMESVIYGTGAALNAKALNLMKDLIDKPMAHV